MSALQYLNKKSWHTATIKNNEKKWLREQEAAKEKARIEELQKELAEERRQEQLQRLEEESGRVDPKASLKRQRLNWMYEYGRDENENEKLRVAKEKEDILLGKKAVDIETVGEVERAERANLVDMEAKMREDPLVQIEMQRAKLRALAGISEATTTTQNPTGLGKVRASDKSKSELLAKEKAQRKDERRRKREMREIRREQRALQRQGANSRVSDGSRPEIHSRLKNIVDDNEGVSIDGAGALKRREQDEQQCDYKGVRESRLSRSKENFENQTDLHDCDSSERRGLHSYIPWKTDNVYRKQRQKVDGKGRLYRTNFDDSDNDGRCGQKRARDESDGILDYDVRRSTDEKLPRFPGDARDHGDFRRLSRWDLRSDSRKGKH